MSAAVATLLAFLVYGLGFRFYSRHLSSRVFGLDASRVTPAHSCRDDVDYVPTNRFVLFGHHWASITGLAPMLGPAVAVIWGWGPAMLWVVLGAVLVGCVHDFSALVVSMRARGQSVGKVAEGVIGPRAKLLFLLIIFFGIALAMGVFTIAIAGLFAGKYASAVLPSGGLMIVAAIIGWLVYKKGVKLLPLALAGFVIQLVLVWVGHQWPLHWGDAGGWKVTLLAYALAASILPVWSLLQPRDFLNSLVLYLGLGLAYVGFFVASPEFAAPMVNEHPTGAPSIFPFVFTTIACGAASGFHGLVSSGTTSKQINKETDARFIGYGAMVGESLLGLLAVLATAAGISMAADNPSAAWGKAYGHHVNTGTALENFIDGTARFIQQLGFDHDLAMAFIAVLVVSFALTTLDSATRLLRYNVAEIGEAVRLPILSGRVTASVIAVIAIAFFAFYEIGGEPMGRVLWQLFGTTNQLLAALTLLTVTLYLKQRGKNPLFTGVPMLFMLVTAFTAMVANLGKFSGQWTFDDSADTILFTVGAVLLVLAIWVVVEALLATRRTLASGTVNPSMSVFPEPSDDA
ncbi:MAG: carbon starvation protein A [Planctomycetes bacterium]|nr:carbon starvation protein A [Planctomycetota bacterium]